MKKKNEKIIVDGIDAGYYENNDLSEMMKETEKRAKIYKARKRRVTMNLPNNSYHDAVDLDQHLGVGYQNVLKVAMYLGLQEMKRKEFQKVDLDLNKKSKKTIKKKKRK